MTSDAIPRAEMMLGFELRDFQRAAIDALVGGRDVMVSAPTGSGKTAIYQAACWAMRDRAASGHAGVTVVLSPLIALIRDQHRRMEEAGISSACFFSQVPYGQRRAWIDMVESGEIDLVLTTPESLSLSKRLRTALHSAGVSLLVVDEAHAYEEWAHSFRPAYRRMGWAARMIGAERAMVCSATMSPLAAAEAAESLDRWDWEIVVASPDRPNLRYVNLDVDHPASLLADLAKQTRVGNWLNHAIFDRTSNSPSVALHAPGILYCTAVRSASNIHEKAKRAASSDWPVDLYHGMMSKRRRNAAQTKWMEGGANGTSPRWLLGTKAFGMGIDKADVRTILHLELPASLIDYAQESGRAGRDGLPAVCALNGLDRGRVAGFLVEQGYPPVEVVESVYGGYLGACGGTEQWAQVPASRITTDTGVREESVRSARGWLRGAGIADVRPADRNWYFEFNEIGIAALAKSARGRKRSEVVKLLKRHGRPATGDAVSLSPEELSDVIYPVLKDWRSALQRLQRDGAIDVRRESRASWVNVRKPFEDFNAGKLHRARDHAWKKYHEMRAFAELPDVDRSAAVTNAMRLSASEAREEVRWRREEAG